MTDQTPRTEAGRRLLDALRPIKANASIRAIEAEAAAQARAEVAHDCVEHQVQARTEALPFVYGHEAWCDGKHTPGDCPSPANRIDSVWTDQTPQTDSVFWDENAHVVPTPTTEAGRPIGWATCRHSADCTLDRAAIEAEAAAQARTEAVTRVRDLLGEWPAPYGEMVPDPAPEDGQSYIHRADVLAILVGETE